MLPSPNFNANVIAAIPPGAIKDNAAFTSQVLDLTSDALRGAQFLTFAVTVGAIDVDMAVLKVMESTVKTNATTLGGTPAEVVDVLDTVTPGPTDDDKVYLVTIDLRAERSRYLQLQATAGNGTAGAYLSAVAFAVCPNAIATNNNAASIIAG